MDKWMAFVVARNWDVSYDTSHESVPWKRPSTWSHHARRVAQHCRAPDIGHHWALPCRSISEFHFRGQSQSLGLPVIKIRIFDRLTPDCRLQPVGSMNTQSFFHLCSAALKRRHINCCEASYSQRATKYARCHTWIRSQITFPAHDTRSPPPARKFPCLWC